MSPSPACDIVVAAVQALGTPYVADAALSDAPLRFSGTSFIVWLYAGIGILLRDDLLELHRCGRVHIGSAIEPADLVFRSGRNNRYHPGDHRLGLAHVGVYSGTGFVIHACPIVGYVAADRLDDFLKKDEGKYRGVRRLLAC